MTDADHPIVIGSESESGSESGGESGSESGGERRSESGSEGEIDIDDESMYDSDSSRTLGSKDSPRSNGYINESQDSLMSMGDDEPGGSNGRVGEKQTFFSKTLTESLEDFFGQCSAENPDLTGLEVKTLGDWARIILDSIDAETFVSGRTRKEARAAIKAHMKDHGDIPDSSYAVIPGTPESDV